MKTDAHKKQECSLRNEFAPLWNTSAVASHFKAKIVNTFRRLLPRVTWKRMHFDLIFCKRSIKSEAQNTNDPKISKIITFTILNSKSFPSLPTRKYLLSSLFQDSNLGPWPWNLKLLSFLLDQPVTKNQLLTTKIHNLLLWPGLFSFRLQHQQHKSKHLNLVFGF